MRFSTKLAILFWICTIGTTSVTVAFLYKEAASAIRKEAGARLMDAAVCAAQMIDPAAHSRITNSEGEGGPSHKAIMHKLAKFRQANPNIRHIYTLVHSSKPNELKFVVDVGENPPLLAHVGCPLDVSRHPEIKNAFEHPVADPVIRPDAWGTWLSGYAPVHNSDGKVVAIVGLDIAVDRVLQAENRIRLAATLAILAAMVLATLLSKILSLKMSGPLMRLTEATRQIADGQLDCSISMNSQDEIGMLASSLNRMATSLKESQASLTQRANTDGLTGLFNHRYFQERLTQELKRAIRYNHQLTLMMIDLDGFKQVNDNLGHPAGDMILRNFSKILNEEKREIDIAARYGGDEFALILPETGIDEAKIIAERIRVAVDEHPHLASEKADDAARYNQWKITLSIGLAECPVHSRQRDALVSAADIAMYHAKHASQNAVCTYDDVPGAGSSMDPCRIYTFLQSASVSTIAALAAAVDAKDHYTHGHSESVARYSGAIATELRLSQEDCFNVRIAALLHDVGKIGMPDTILNNPGHLDAHEREIIQNHPSVGEKIVKQIPQLQKILPGILYHHERYDGTGYPCGLAADKIPLVARIICVADSFDAMTSNRPYRNAMSVADALKELRNYRGIQFDPLCVDALLRWIQTTEAKAA